MIQRVQSIYLLGAAVFMLLFYFAPIAVFTTNTFPFEFFNCHITHPENLEPPITLVPLAVLPIFSIGLSFVAIFLFNNRKLQMRLGKLNLLVLVLTIGLAVFYFVRLKNLLVGSIEYGFSAAFPILAFIMIAMANRAIKKDENLIRAADRIR